MDWLSDEVTSLLFSAALVSTFNFEEQLPNLEPDQSNCMKRGKETRHGRVEGVFGI